MIQVSRFIAPTLLMAAFVVAQTSAPTSSLKFEAASIKPARSGAPPGGLRPAPGGKRYIGSNLPLRVYLIGAYQVKIDQITGGPGWIDTAPYDLNAEAERPSSLQDLHIMLQNLLNERFKLQFHHAMKEMSAYVLTVTRSGPRNLNIHPNAGAGDVNFNQQVEPVANAKWTARCASLDTFAFQLGLYMDRPVVNQTNLTGCFDFELTFKWERGLQDPQAANGVTADSSAPSIYDALQNELGLRLDAKKVPVDTMVIDHAERPTDE